MSNLEARVVIIGANFAGLAAAKHLESQAEVVLIDPYPYFEFTPNIHELISDEKRPADLQLDRKSVISALGHSWIQDKVASIERDIKEVVLASGQSLSYDACIITTGGVSNFRGVKGVEQHAIPFKSVNDCFKIGEKIREFNQKGNAYSVVIAGGGSVGVEALGELLRYREQDTPINIQLVEAQDRLLSGFSPKVNKEILRLCENQNVNFHFGSRIEEVSANTVKLSDGKILNADICIWTAGVQPNPLLFQAGLSDSAHEYAAVHPNLQSMYDENIFVAGDAADLGSMDSKQAFFAMESGEKAADNVFRFLNGKTLRRFFKIPRPYLYSFGDMTCFLIFHDLVLSGKPLLLLKESIFRITIEGIRAGNSCQSILKMVDKLFPQYLKDARSNFRSFIKNPIKFVLKPPVSIL